MILPRKENLGAKIEVENPDHRHRLETLKSRLRLAYMSVIRANRKSHQRNKRICDVKATKRQLKPRDLVFLYVPAVKKGRTKKIRKVCSGLFKVTKKLSALNYEIVYQSGRTQVVHVNRLKKACKSIKWERRKTNGKRGRRREKPAMDNEAEVLPGSHPIECRETMANRLETGTPPNANEGSSPNFSPRLQSRRPHLSA
jgi:hypothetical protein